MRTIRRSSPFENLPEALRAFLLRRAAGLLGLGLIGLAAAVTVALATWSVDDPSLNHATDAPVHNLLRAPGAIVADLAMQLFGLGSVPLLAPVLAWGWQLLRARKVGRLGLRCALWVAGSWATPSSAPRRRCSASRAGPVPALSALPSRASRSSRLRPPAASA